MSPWRIRVADTHYTSFTANANITGINSRIILPWMPFYMHLIKELFKHKVVYVTEITWVQFLNTNTVQFRHHAKEGLSYTEQLEKKIKFPRHF
jgi:hypothetical protein